MIVGAGYIGLEMAEALTARGLAVTQVEQLPEVLPTVDPQLGALVRAQLEGHGVTVLSGTAVRQVSRAGAGAPARLRVDATAPSGRAVTLHAGLVLVVTGVRPETSPRRQRRGRPRGARRDLRSTRRCGPACPASTRPATASSPTTGCWARPGSRWAPPRTSRAGSPGRTPPAGTASSPAALGTQVVKVFDHAAARTGLRDHEAAAAGYDPVTVAWEADDHKAYYPGSHRIAMRFTGDRATGRLLGVQLFGHKHAEIAKRIDIAAAAIYSGLTVDEISDLDLSYTPPLGSPWDAVQAGAQAWTAARLPPRRDYAGAAGPAPPTSAPSPPGLTR